MSQKIICIGEILWDKLPTGTFLGGAPFNVACHLAMLGEKVEMISKVGNDDLGKQAITQIKERGIKSEYIQIDNNYKTGVVNVSLTKDGDAKYEIVEPAAWDFIESDNIILNFNLDCDFLVFGTLAQRNVISRNSIKKLRSESKINVYDVNLRFPFIDKKIVNDSLLDAEN